MSKTKVALNPRLRLQIFHVTVKRPSKVGQRKVRSLVRNRKRTNVLSWALICRNVYLLGIQRAIKVGNSIIRLLRRWLSLNEQNSMNAITQVSENRFLHHLPPSLSPTLLLRPLLALACLGSLMMMMCQHLIQRGRFLTRMSLLSLLLHQLHLMHLQNLQ